MNKKIWLISWIVLLSLSPKGYCGLQLEKELAQKFCPSLQLHLGDQGLAPKPVEIMSNGRADGRTSYLDENNLYVLTFDKAGDPVGDFDVNDKWPMLVNKQHGVKS